MSKHYFSYQDEEAYKEGRQDQQHHRPNYERNRYSESDRAYFEGRDDERRMEEQAKLDEEQERQEMERQERIEFQRYMEEQQEFDYYDQMCNDEETNKEIEELSNLDIDTIFLDDDDEE